MEIPKRLDEAVKKKMPNFRIHRMDSESLLLRELSVELIGKALTLAHERRELAEPDLLYPLLLDELKKDENYSEAWYRVALSLYAKALKDEGSSISENSGDPLQKEIATELSTTATEIGRHLGNNSHPREFAYIFDFIEVDDKQYDLTFECPGMSYAQTWIKTALEVVERIKNQKKQ